MKLFKLFNSKDAAAEEFSGNRRCSKRYEIPLKINYFEPLTRLEGSTLSRNISSRSLCFSIKTRLPKGSLLNLMVEDPISEKSIFARAKVIWIEEFVTGDNAENIRYETGVKLLNKKLF